MKDLEANKIVAGVLVAALIAMACGKIAGALYHPVEEPENRGYTVEVADANPAGDGAQTEEVIDLAVLLASADLASGEKTFKKCAACHTIESGGPNKVGPNLHGILGADIAHHADFAYSEVLSGKEGSWDYDKLFAFITKPKDFAPGTKMSFIGIKKPQDVADVIAFLRSNGSTSVPLPVAQAAPAAPDAEDAGQEQVDTPPADAQPASETTLQTEEHDGKMNGASEESATSPGE